MAASSYIYKCIICHRHFPTWWISKRVWKTSLIGFIERAMEKFECDIDDRTMLCKECFEEIQRQTAADPPRYFTINQYITYRVARTMHGDLTEVKRILEQIWDLPAAYHTAEHPASTAHDSPITSRSATPGSEAEEFSSPERKQLIRTKSLIILRSSKIFNQFECKVLLAWLEWND